MNNYQTTILCTYKQMDNEFEQEDLYRMQFLQIFNLEEYNDDLVNVITKELFNEIFKNYNYNHTHNINIFDLSFDFDIILNKAKENNELAFMMAIICPDGEKDNEYKLTLFRLLFKYEYFDLFHKCISEYLRNGSISFKTKEDIMQEL